MRTAGALECCQRSRRYIATNAPVTADHSGRPAEKVRRVVGARTAALPHRPPKASGRWTAQTGPTARFLRTLPVSSAAAASLSAPDSHLRGVTSRSGTPTLCVGVGCTDRKAC